MGPVDTSPRERAFMALMLSSARQVTDARARSAFVAFRADEAARATMAASTGGRAMEQDNGVSFTYAAQEKPTTIGQAMAESRKALDSASDEALRLAAEKVTARDLYDLARQEAVQHTKGLLAQERVVRAQALGFATAEQQGAAGRQERTFTRIEVLTLLRGELARGHTSSIIALMNLITIFENME